MKFIFDGKQYALQFAYGLVETVYGNNRRGVYCTILDANDLPLTSCYAACAPQDKFLKETGRKKSLTLALQTYPVQDFPKQFRAAAWKAYFSRRETSNGSK